LLKLNVSCLDEVAIDVAFFCFKLKH